MGSLNHLPEADLLRMIDEEPELTIKGYLDFLRELQEPATEVMVRGLPTLSEVVKEYLAVDKEPPAPPPAATYSSILGKANEPHSRSTYASRYTLKEIEKVVDALGRLSAINVCSDLGMKKDQFRALCFGWRKRGFDVPVVSFKN